MNIEEITAQITDMVIEYAPKFALAIITLVVGMWVIKRLVDFFFLLRNLNLSNW